MGINEPIEEITTIYAEEILPLRSRRIELLGRRCEPLIQTSFLGVELKLRHKRITCPDMVTARYLRVFAALGMRSVAVPYDPTETARILPRLEAAFRRFSHYLEVKEGGLQLDRNRVGQCFRRLKNRLLKVEDLEAEKNRGAP